MSPYPTAAAPGFYRASGFVLWGMQDLVRKLDAVITTRVGYSGGDVAHATDRRHGTHAEAIEIVFDADRLSFRNLLEFFFQRLELMNWREVFGDTASAACSAPAHPQRPELGTRAFGLGPALWIERDDFAEIAQKFSTDSFPTTRCGSSTV
jgi:hypothetical protein